MKWFSRLTLLTLILVLTATMAVSAQETSITMLYWPGPESEAMVEVVEHYNATQGEEDGVHVDMLLFGRQGFFERQETALSGGTTDFDITFPPTYVLGRLATHMDPIEPYFDDLGKLDNLEIYSEAALDSLTYDDELYALPTDSGFHLNFYREDLIGELLENPEWQELYAEITAEHLGEEMEPKHPEEWTWDDYAAVSLFFTRSINPESPTEYGTTLQLQNLIFNVLIWNDLLYAYGGNYVENGDVVLESEAALEALDVYMTIIENNATPPASINYEFPETNAAFNAEQAATIIQFVAAHPILTDDLESPNVYDRVGVAPVPAGPEGNKVHVHNLGVGINTYSENKEEASKFLAFLATEEAMAMYNERGGLPPVEGVMDDFYVENINEYGFTQYIGPETMSMLEIMAGELSAAWSGDKPAEEAIQDAQQAIENLF